MANYIFRRLMLASLTLLMVTILVFGLMRAMPGSPLTLNLEDPSRQLRKEDIELLKEQYGLNKPWYVAYVGWLGNVLQGDLSESFHLHKDVTVLIGERIGPTLLLSLTSMFLTYVLSMPIGLYSSVRHGKYGHWRFENHFTRVGADDLSQVAAAPRADTDEIHRVLLCVFEDGFARLQVFHHYSPVLSRRNIHGCIKPGDELFQFFQVSSSLFLHRSVNKFPFNGGRKHCLKAITKDQFCLGPGRQLDGKPHPCLGVR